MPGAHETRRRTMGGGGQAVVEKEGQRTEHIKG